jgi:HlyD family secretion protein
VRQGRSRRGALVFLVVASVAAIVAYALWPSAVPVETARVSRGSLEVTIDQEGETRVHDRYVLSAPVLGRLMRVDLEDGDPVRRDQVVARIDPLPLNQRERQEVTARVQSAEASLREAKAREARARAVAGQARRDRDRAEHLARDGVISAQALDQARNADVTAAQELLAAEYSSQAAASDVKVARAGLVGIDDSGKPRPLIELRSPVAGRVLRVVEKSEHVVSAGTQIMILGEPGQLEVVADVLSTDAVKVHPGDPVLLTAWGGDHVIRARVRLVEPGGFTKVSALGVEEQRVNVIADFVDSPGSLGDGYRVEAHIIIWSGQNVLKVPLSALFRRGQRWSTFVVDRGRASARDVKVGHRNDSEAEVLSGLTEGEQVIVHPSNEVADGIRVRATPFSSNGTRQQEQ